jgi:hypothetical protein
MPDYRCLKHDRVFETATDSRRPGSNATATLAAHPHDGHPDCPKCAEDIAALVATPADLYAAARAKAAAAAADALAAQQVASDAAFAASQFNNITPESGAFRAATPGVSRRIA